MCGCNKNMTSTKAGAPSGVVFPGSGEVAIWMHKAGMTFSQRIIALGSVSGRTIFFTQDRTLPVDIQDFDSLKTAVEASGGMLMAQPDWMYYSSPANIASHVAPSGITYSFAIGFKRPVLVSDVAAIEATHGITLSN
jgi:hypothetical protein